MKKSILGGDKDEEQLAKLTKIYDCGMAATRLAEGCNERMTAGTFVAMRDDIDLIVKGGHQLTENTARRWCVQTAEHCFSKGNVVGFVNSLRVWLKSDETRHKDETTFDHSAPEMWQVTPLKEDEDALDEDPEPKPILPADIREWEMARAFDRNTKAFASLLISGFSSDTLYKHLKTDHVKARTVLEAWLGSQDNARTDHLGSRVRAAVAVCNTFARAYLSVADDTTMTTRETFDDFSQVFVVSTAMGSKVKVDPQKAEFFQLMALTCRRHPNWKDMESCRKVCS